MCVFNRYGSSIFNGGEFTASLSAQNALHERQAWVPPELQTHFLRYIDSRDIQRSRPDPQTSHSLLSPLCDCGLTTSPLPLSPAPPPPVSPCELCEPPDRWDLTGT